MVRLGLRVEVCQCVRIQRVVGVPEEVDVVRSSVEHIGALVKVGDGGVFQRCRRLIGVPKLVLQSVDSSGLAVGDIPNGNVEELGIRPRLNHRGRLYLRRVTDVADPGDEDVRGGRQPDVVDRGVARFLVSWSHPGQDFVVFLVTAF